MARAFSLKEHHSWEDLLGVGLGLLLIASPWLIGSSMDPMVTFNAVAMGILVMVLATMEFVDRHYWEETAEVVVGLWVTACPFIYGYINSGLGYTHLAIGIVVALLAALELSQTHTPTTTT